MTRHRVAHGVVTVQTAVNDEGARAWVDVAPGRLLPADVPADEVAALLRQGRIEVVEGTPDPPPPPERPAKSASKADWVAYAQTVDPETGGLNELTKEQPVELYGGGGDGG